MATMEEAKRWIEDHTVHGVRMCPACMALPAICDEEYDWKVFCPHCTDLAKGDTKEAAIEAWNAGITAEYVREIMDQKGE